MSAHSSGDQLAQHGGQQLPLARRVVGQKDVAEEGPPVAQQHGGLARRTTFGIVPLSDHPGMVATGSAAVMFHDAWRTAGGKPGTSGASKRIEAELLRPLGPNVVELAEPQGRL